MLRHFNPILFLIYKCPAPAGHTTTVDEVEVLSEATDGIRTRETGRGMHFGRKKTRCGIGIEVGTGKGTRTGIGAIRTPDHHALTAIIATVHAVVALGEIQGPQTDARERVHDLVLGRRLLIMQSLTITGGINGKKTKIGNGVGVESGGSGKRRRKIGR